MIKSVYDPSPVGYSLPASNVFTGFTNKCDNIVNDSTHLTGIRDGCSILNLTNKVLLRSFQPPAFASALPVRWTT